MRLFAASIGTETNTFAPIPTALESFHEAFYAPPGQHPEDAKLCTAPLWVARRRARAEGWTLIEGSCSWAEPAGLVSRQAFEQLRDEVLGQLRAALPLDGVVLGLHGAMVADGYDDCEGDLLEQVRAIVGPNVPIGVELDPHCHLTRKRVRNATLIICFKEFPHTDFVARGEEVVELTLRAARGEIKPVMSVCDCRMIGSFPTTIQPMRAFVDKFSALEGKDGVLSVSAAHCFPYADVPEMGARMLVITDDRQADGDRLAMALGEEFFAMRGKTLPPYHTPDEVIDLALADHGPVVIADPSDNPGGGAPGDSTVILRRLTERGIKGAALAGFTVHDSQKITDPCFMAQMRQLHGFFTGFRGQCQPFTTLTLFPISSECIFGFFQRIQYGLLVIGQTGFGTCISGFDTCIDSSQIQCRPRNSRAHGIRLGARSAKAR